MSSKVSSGILLYRVKDNTLEVFLVHPGGLFYKNKDEGSWTIPKGEVESHEELVDAALREFHEETGIVAKGNPMPIGSVKQKGGKTVHCFALAGDIDESKPIQSVLFELEWPPHSGKKELFPEVDKGEFFPVNVARTKINPSQRIFLDKLMILVSQETSN